MKTREAAAALREVAAGLTKLAAALDETPVAKKKVEGKLVGEALRRAFRDWVVGRGRIARTFEAADVIAALGISDSTSRKLLDWGLKRKPPMIEIVDSRPAKRSAGAETSGGRPARVYAYVDPKRVASRSLSRSNGHRESAATPVPGTTSKRSRKGGKETRKLLSALEPGWRIETATGHVKVYDPDGNLRTTLAGTPGGGRWLANAKADLRRQGAIR